MAEVLSQQEIDLLLNNVKGGQGQVPAQSSDKEVIPFDFRLPNRITKSQLRTFRTIHENFGESFASFLVSKLQTIVSINVTSVDQIYYSEYILSVSKPYCLFTFEINNYDVKGVLELNIDLALNLVDRLLGGNGKGTKQNKIITPIEQKVLSVIVERIMQDLKKGWQIVDDMDFKIDKFEPDIDFAQITSANESVLVISFEILIGEQSYLMNLCFATFSFDSILAKLSKQSFSSIRRSKYQDDSSRDVISKHLYQMSLPVVVEFGTAKISMDELINLQKGDIIKLDTNINYEHPVKIHNKVLFAGRAGVVNNHKAIKITKKFKAENNKTGDNNVS
jgi:flagellar motor switch protein FliM